METGSTPSDGLTPFRDRRVIVACVLLFALGWFSGQGRGNPFVPPQPKRPVLAALAKVAKAALWLLVVEPVPDDLPDDHFVVHAHTDRINHREGW
jgi:hypothetical protein